jgi:calcium-dependent protein kinase
VHRDLKPENIMLYEDDLDSTLKLIDFGLSKTYETGDSFRTKAGTAYYVSPDLLSGSYTEKTDVWSAGVILYVLLSGKPPFYGQNDAAILDMIRYSEPSFADPVFNSVSESAIDLITKMLIKEPSLRPSMEEVINHPWLQ